MKISPVMVSSPVLFSLRGFYLKRGVTLYEICYFLKTGASLLVPLSFHSGDKSLPFQQYLVDIFTYFLGHHSGLNLPRYFGRYRRFRTLFWWYFDYFIFRPYGNFPVNFIYFTPLSSPMPGPASTTALGCIWVSGSLPLPGACELERLKALALGGALS